MAISEALSKAHEIRKANAAAGIKQNKNVVFSGTDSVTVAGKAFTEVELIKLAAKRDGDGGMTDYVRKVVFAQAALDSQKPVAERHTKTVEELEKELEALAARVAEKKAKATA